MLGSTFRKVRRFKLGIEGKGNQSPKTGMLDCFIDVGF